jgi:hypothetical protein
MTVPAEATTGGLELGQGLARARTRLLRRSQLHVLDLARQAAHLV